jgi:hypothetical protein
MRLGILLVALCGCSPPHAGLPPACVSSAPLVDEAGFLELADDAPATSRTRLFYDFQRADEAPQTKPLFVFFNGGPGFATALLRSLHTGRTTIDPAGPSGGAPPSDVGGNPSSWTAFGNLLYIDARDTGFSYDVNDGSGGGMAGGFGSFNPLVDAGQFVRATLQFLDSHAQLRCGSVVLVGESYGGVRATLMLDDLLHPDEMGDFAGGAATRDAIAAHLRATRPELAAPPAGTLASQFGRQVLIQPLVLGETQMGLQTRSEPATDPSHDGYNQLEAPGWTTQVEQSVTAANTDVVRLAALLGVDPRTIPELLPEARQNAYRDMPTPTALDATLGALKPSDCYFKVFDPQSGGDLDTSARFLRVLPLVDTFITDAAQDRVIWSPAIAPALATHTDVVARAALDQTPRPGVARPGWISVDFVDGKSGRRVIRMPTYDRAGHPVSASQPAELAADVAAWLRGE